MRVVLDTNTVISGLAKKNSPPAHVLALWRSGTIEVFTCDATIDELARVLRYPRVRKLTELTDAEVEAFLALYRRDTSFMRLNPSVDAITEDPDDDRFLTLARAAEAEYLITGDRKHLLPLVEYEGTTILAAHDFMALIDKS